MANCVLFGEIQWAKGVARGSDLSASLFELPSGIFPLLKGRVEAPKNLPELQKPAFGVPNALLEAPRGRSELQNGIFDVQKPVLNLGAAQLDGKWQ